MTVTIPSVERTVVAWLRGLSLPTTRIATRNPSSFDEPWVVVQDFGGPQIGGTLHLLERTVQISCYGGSDINTAQAQAQELHDLIIGASESLLGEHDECVISRVTHGSFGRLPDEQFEGRERYILQLTMRLRP